MKPLPPRHIASPGRHPEVRRTIVSPPCTVVLLGLLLLAMHTAAFAQVAILPVEDLRIGSGNTNWAVTEILENHLRDKGVDSIPSRQLLDFLAAHRIRTVGHFSLAEIALAGEELGCSHLVLATLTQLDENRLSFGMTIKFIRTSDGRVTWASTVGLNRDEIQTPLGIAAPDAMTAITETGMERLLTGMPAPEHPPKLSSATPPQQFLVASVHLAPTYIKPGETIRCSVRFNPLAALPDKVMFKVGSTVHLAEKKPAENTFQAAWDGEKGPAGNSPRLAALTPTRDMFQGSWQSPDDDSSHEVVMVAIADNGEKTEHYIGSYKVDSSPPGGVLTVKGKMIDGIPTFSGQTSIHFRLAGGEPLSRWKIVIVNGNGEPVSEYDGKDTVCDGSVTWNGQTSKGSKAPAGIYAVSLQAWDRAGNFSQTTETVRYVPEPVAPIVSMKADADGATTINLVTDSDIPVKYWSLQLWNKNNDLLLERYGDSLPGTVIIKGGIGSLTDSEISCRVTATDLLGNKVVNTIDNVQQLAAGRTTQEHLPTPAMDSWVEDF
ncbi:MAG: FlgD immunoglobulin-like domain containing protein [Thermodesulfobacteriota bacterium]